MRTIDLKILLIIFVLIVVALMTVYPLGILVYGSFRSDAPGKVGEFTLDGYREAFADSTIVKAFWTTFWVGSVRTVLSMALAIFFCWVIVRTDTPGRGLLEFLLWINFFLPNLPLTMGWILILDPTYGLFNQLLGKLPFVEGPVFNIYSYAGIILMHIGLGTSTKVLMLAPAFRNMDAAIEEAGAACGSSNIRTLVSVTFPLLLPAVMGATLLTFIRSLESFEIEFLLGTPAKIYVYSTKVYDLLRWEPPRFPPATALSGLFLLSIFMCVFIYRKAIAHREYTTVTGKGFRTRPIKLGKWKYLTFIVLILYLSVFTLLPVVTLVLGTFMRISGMFDLPDPYTLAHWKDVLSDPVFTGSLMNSIIVASGAALSGMFLYAIISYIINRTKVRGRRILEFMSWLPWAVPGILLALALLWAVLGTGLLVPLYGTPYILIIAILIKEMPIGVRIMDGSMVQVHKELEEAASVAGDSWFGTFRRIMVPLLSPSFITIGVIIFLASMKEISGIILLYSPNWRVLSILMLENYIAFSPEKGMVVGVIITFIVIAMALVARSFGLKVGKD